MNPWATRLQVCAAMLLAIMAHACATDSTPNTPVAMLVYHGSGALIDWMLALIFAAVLTGRRGTVMRWLMLAAIGGNFAGWLLYMMYVSPIYYNVLMWGLTCTQCLCLLYPGRNDAGITWLALVRHSARFSGGNPT